MHLKLQNYFTPAAGGNGDHPTTSAKTRNLQIDHRLGQGATKAMGDLFGVISVALKLY
jgi:hypothetical protein